jgi:hypothetical protein
MTNPVTHAYNMKRMPTEVIAKCITDSAGTDSQTLITKG